MSQIKDADSIAAVLDAQAARIAELEAALKRCVSWMANCPARTEARAALKTTESAR